MDLTRSSPTRRIAGGTDQGARTLILHLTDIRGGPIGLQLRASNEGLLRPRVARAKETNGLPLPPYTGRGARTVGLVGHRTRYSPTFTSHSFV